MSALQEIETRVSATYPDNEVKAGGDYWHQPLGGTDDNGEWKDEGGGWIIKNSIELYLNSVLVFERTEEDVVNFDCERYKMKVLEHREDFLIKMNAELLAAGY